MFTVARKLLLDIFTMGRVILSMLPVTPKMNLPKG